MPSKNNISHLVLPKKEEPILPKTSEPKKEREPRTPKPKRIGRPKKSASEKRNFKITLSLTQMEGAKIEEKAGLADKATYLYDFLKKAGVFD